MQKYEVTGMSCAACVARVEKAVSKVQGVDSCAVSLLTNSMAVEGNVDPSQILKAVTDAGYGAKCKDDTNKIEENKNATSSVDQLKDTETPKLIKRLITSAIVLVFLMYFTMGHMMLGWPLPPFFTDNHVAMGLVQLILSSIILLINKKFFVSGVKSAIHGSPNMDTLVSLGSGVSFLWSIYVLFRMTRSVVDGDTQTTMVLMDSFYFESAAMILVLITLGKMLEALSKGKTTSALKSLMSLAPKTAVILDGQIETVVPVEQVKTEDIFIVRPGDSIPVDGFVIEGSSAVDESPLTGESIPVDKVKDSKVSSGTLNQSGFLKCKATRVGKDTTINQIIQMVSDAATTKAPVAKIADKVSGVFVPAVIAVAIVTFIVWLLLGRDFAYALERGISVLVISCPCALGLATPVAIMVANGKGARNGILFKTAQSLEETGKVNIVALDKTGTITKGQPTVTDVIPCQGVTEQELLQTAINLEDKSQHPLAKAIIAYGKEKGLKPQNVTDFVALGGKGVKAKLNDEELKGGNKHTVPTAKDYDTQDLSLQGKTPLYFEKSNKFLGTIAVADTIKQDSPKAIKAMQSLGLKVVMITGDNQITANKIGEQCGVDQVIAEVLPEQKAQAIKDLQQNGKYKVCMVGDGINDAPALTVADIGMAIGNGTDVALDAADVVLVKGSLLDGAAAIKLSKKALVNIKQNLFWAFIYNVIGIPLAAGAYVKLFGWSMNPMFGAAAMSLSSVCVVTNALRLNLVKIYDKVTNAEPNVQTNNIIKESQNMTKTLKVVGMMCSHCEGHVKEALEKIDGVVSAVTSHEKQTAVVELSKDVSEEVLAKAVTDCGYQYLGME